MRASFSMLFVHLVWATRDRRATITPEVEVVVARSIIAATAELGGEAVAFGCADDHGHVLARIPTTLSIAKPAQRLKGVSARRVNQHGTAGDRSPFEPFRWQGAYGAFSVSRWDVGRVAAYVRRQRQRHREATLSANLEAITLPHESAKADSP